MPKPIVCLSAPLRQFVERFRSCFSRRQWRYFVIVLLGLIECEERKTLTGLLRVIGESVSLSRLSRFLSKWPWSSSAVAQQWENHFRERLSESVQTKNARQKVLRPRQVGRPKQTVVTGFGSLGFRVVNLCSMPYLGISQAQIPKYVGFARLRLRLPREILKSPGFLIFDDSVHIKPQGRTMGGPRRHYSNTEQKVVSGHCLFSGLYVLLGQRYPLEPKMYCQKAVCKAEGIPFQSKVDMAVAEIAQFEPVAATHTYVLVDSWYHCRKVRRAVQQRGWDLSSGLKSNRVMRLIQVDGSRE